MTDEPQHPLSKRTPKPAPASKSAGKANTPKRAKSAGKGPKSAKRGGPMKRRRPRRPSAAHSGPPEGTVRIQKLLAEAGIASRRACEQLVEEGNVKVNGQVVTELPIFVNPATDEVRVNNRRVTAQGEKKVYVLLNKPRGVVCTNADPEGRPRAVDLVTTVEQRLFPVGRLDIDSVGLILLTNDGELANRIMHPRYGLVKTYVAEVDGRIEGDAVDKMRQGIYLDGKKTQGVGVKILKKGRNRSLLEVQLREGKNREIRRVLARLGYKVRTLRRVAIGPINDRGIKTGNYRMLKRGEVKQLYGATKQD